jgi:hypothetical protein
MLNSGIKILALRDKENRYSNSRVERNKAPYPPPFKLNGGSLTRQLLNQRFFLVKLNFESFTVATMTWLTVMEYLCHKWPRYPYVLLVGNTSRSFPNSCLITGFVTRLTRRVSLVEQELPTLPEHLSSPPVLSGVRVPRSLVYVL